MDLVYGTSSADLRAKEFAEIYFSEFEDYNVNRSSQEHAALARTLHLSNIRGLSISPSEKYYPQEALRLLWTSYGRGLINGLDMIKCLDNNAKFKLPSNQPKATPKATLCEVAKVPPSSNKSHAKDFSASDWLAKALVGGVVRILKDSSSPKLNFKSTSHNGRDIGRDMGLIDEITEVIATGLRLVTTEDSKFGMAPPQAQPGDVIYQLEGCRHTVVLRCMHPPVDGEFTVVGPSHVDPYHMKDLEPIDSRFQEILIR